MDNQDPSNIDVMSQIKHMINHEVEHAVDSPATINRTVGEAMRHIGAVLTSQSSAYLPIRHEEILVKPEQLRADDFAAVLLINRTYTHSNCFSVLADIVVDGDVQQVTIRAFQSDEFNLMRTKFLKLPEPINAEIVRQLKQLFIKTSTVLAQVAVVPDYFKPKEGAAPELFSTDMSTDPGTGAAPTVSAEPSALPAVVDDRLL